MQMIDSPVTEELAVLTHITDVAVKLASAGLTEQADWAGKQAALLTSALAKRYWEEPELTELGGGEPADGGVGLGERKAKVVEVEETHEVGARSAWRQDFGRISELTVLPVDAVPSPTVAEGAGVELGDEAVGQMADEEFPATTVRLARKRKSG